MEGTLRSLFSLLEEAKSSGIMNRRYIDEINDELLYNFYGVFDDLTAIFSFYANSKKSFCVNISIMECRNMLVCCKVFL